MSEQNPAFELTLNEEEGTVLIKLEKSVIGSLANQLKKTPNRRKCVKILRRLGFELARVGDELYGKETQDETVQS